MKKIVLIGSTGSIGRQVIEVVKRHPDEYAICALVTGSGGEAFEKQVREIKPKFCAVASVEKEKALSLAALDGADIIFNAAGGFAGAEYSLRAVKAGKRLALANKESLVCAGDIILPLAKKSGAQIIPVDSEHSAIWQCLNFDCNKPVKRLIITASGGAFRGYTEEMLKGVTAAQALNHPTWRMGRKITVDSATLMNKGYEVIEAHALFGTPYKDVEAVIQPQSIIHSMVEFADGAIIAQLSYPTMEIPVQLALSYPERRHTSLAHMDFTKAFSLGFEPLKKEDYPCFALALKCGQEGSTAPCVLNAADEEAVHAFLNGRIAFTDIFRVADETLQKLGVHNAADFEDIVQTDKTARGVAQKIILRLQ
ncbi:MAG: 1-deoxy-D-xylulose-5-phosphate reductoisomerase [Clostridia bacterium]|nr:1-deoxy-D-xylulose-5-phosphate reductoisomerase [Clostridia bacterium]